MSRIGRMPLDLPEGVSVARAGRSLSLKGKLGQLSFSIPEGIKVEIEQTRLQVSPIRDGVRERALWGTVRAVLGNMAQGVSKGFTKDLEMSGVGYRASVQGQVLDMQMGFSHPVKIEIPQDLKVTCPKPTQISVFGIDRQKVGAMAARVRSIRPPEPYKGKGIKYTTETILRKEGKKK